MAKLTKLITYAYLKEEVDVPQNIPDSDFEKKIYLAQETLRMLMGDEFYQDYIATFAAGPLTGAYADLYPYVKQYIAWQTFEIWTTTANYKPTRSGFRVHTEDNSEPVSDLQMSIIIKQAKQQTQMYKKYLVDYLDGNSSNYPLYSSHCNNDLVGNSFHISVVKNKHHNHNCSCNRCRC